MIKMKLLKDKVYYKDKHPEEWEYVQNNHVGEILCFCTHPDTPYQTDRIGEETPFEMGPGDYAFMIMPEPPKPKTLLDKVEELYTYKDSLIHKKDVINLIRNHHEGPIR